jgi:hypothetical protein
LVEIGPVWRVFGRPEQDATRKLIAEAGDATSFEPEAGHIVFRLTLARLRGFACGKPDFAGLRGAQAFDLIDSNFGDNGENGCSEDQLIARGIPRLGSAWQNLRRHVPEKDRTAEEREDASLLERRREPSSR